MESPQSIQTVNGEGSFPHLERLGWASYFQEQISNSSNDLTPARIVGVRKNIYLASRGQEEVPATLSGRFWYEPEICLPAVGDWALLRESVITSVLQRKNVLSRQAAGARNHRNGDACLDKQVIAANLDTVLIVCGLDRDFNLRRIERYLTLVRLCAIEPAVILTKADIHDNPDRFLREVEAVAFGVPVFLVSGDDAGTLTQLESVLAAGRTVALIGSSGAGKSTLINRLIGADIRDTSQVSRRVGKGKHTTTTRDLIVLPSGALVIDNPGIREIALAVEAGQAGSAFPDIEALARSCRFTNCTHTHEPGCVVMEAVSSGEIDPARMRSYQKLGLEISYQAQRESKSASRVERERWKGVSLKRKSIRKKGL